MCGFESEFGCVFLFVEGGLCVAVCLSVGVCLSLKKGSGWGCASVCGSLSQKDTLYP